MSPVVLRGGAPGRSGGIELRFGYSLHDLELMTRAALAADRSMAMDYADRKDIAWSAIAEALYAAETPPLRTALIRAGWQAIYAAVREEYRQYGYADRTYDTGYASARRFVQFWYRPVQPSHEDRIVERIAVGQVLATLTDAGRDAIGALAATEDYRLGAEALGINDSAFTARLATARRKVVALWFQPETPHRTRRTDRRVEVHGKPLATHCGNGHEWTPENTRINERLKGGRLKRRRFCRACERERAERRRLTKVAS